MLELSRLVRVGITILALAAIGCGPDELVFDPSLAPAGGAGGTSSDGGHDASDAASDASDAASDASDASDAGTDAHDAAADADASLDASDASDAPSDSAADGDASDAAPDAACTTGTKDCSGTCRSITDPDYGCAAADCAPCPVVDGGSGCDQTGACRVACTSGTLDCDDHRVGCETDGNIDPNNCGGCGITCARAHAITTCDQGTCKITGCSTGYENCDHVDSNGCESLLASDKEHCGSCSNDCTALGSNLVCELSQCKVSTCPAGKLECDGSLTVLCETNIQTDVQHCGSCSNTCLTAHVAAASCVAGGCAIDACVAGWKDCDGFASTGCEREVFESTASCGACNRPCSSTKITLLDCTGGVCNSTCQPDYGNCSQPTVGNDDGCETNLLTATAHCGQCGHPCSSQATLSTSCVQGQCSPVCQPGRIDCVRPAAPVADDGCETVTSAPGVPAAPAHCGVCGRACSTANTNQVQCGASGQCNSTCNAPFGNCVKPGPPASDDGCETDLGSSVVHCGTCGHACSSANSDAVDCTTGQCAPACKTGFADCQTPTGTDDGCETNTTSNVANCGLCGHACSNVHTSPARCIAGVCSPLCAAGYLDCSKPPITSPDDGCETAQSVSNCGGCARACSSANVVTPLCTGGLCNAACVGPWGNCSTPAFPLADDGCETNLGTSTTNCGSCGRACPTGFACNSGTCACQADADCTGGTCSAGVCTCSGTVCTESQRCVGSPAACG